MKKFLVVLLALVVGLSAVSCDTVQKVVVDKVEDKVEEVIDEKIDLEELGEALFEEDNDGEEAGQRESQQDDEQAAEEQEQKESSSGMFGNGEKLSIDELEGLTGVELVEACQPYFNHDAMNGKESFHMKSKQFSRYGDPSGEYIVDMYFSEGQTSQRLEIIAENSDDSMMMIMNGDEGMMYIVQGNGQAFKMPSFGRENEDDLTGFDFTFDDEVKKEMEETLRDARLEELNGEITLYLEYDAIYDDESDIDRIWLSLERGTWVKIENSLGGEITYSAEVLEFEVGGNYDELFQEPTDVEWASLEDFADM